MAVITGVGIVCALGSSTEEVWRALLDGHSGVAVQPVEGVSGMFPVARAISHPAAGRNGLSRDRRTHLFVQAAEEALAASGLDPADRSGALCVVGVNGGSPQHLLGETGGEEMSVLEEGLGALQSSYEFPAVWAARHLGLYPVPQVHNSACSSGALAIIHGYVEIRLGNRMAAVSGAIGTLDPVKVLGHASIRSMTDGWVRPFSAGRSSIAIGEAGVALVLEEEGQARARKARPLARIRGVGLSNDAYHLTAPDPHGTGAELAIRRALEHARVAPEQVDYIHAHGTGTVLNDRMECAALRRIFGDRLPHIPVTSSKPAAGHTLAAAGALGVALTALSLDTGWLPPTLNFTAPDPECAVDCLPEGARYRPDIRIAVAQAFGFGGVNAVVVLERPEESVWS